MTMNYPTNYILEESMVQVENLVCDRLTQVSPNLEY